MARERLRDGVDLVAGDQQQGVVLPAAAADDRDQIQEPRHAPARRRTVITDGGEQVQELFAPRVTGDVVDEGQDPGGAPPRPWPPESAPVGQPQVVEKGTDQQPFALSLPCRGAERVRGEADGERDEFLPAYRWKQLLLHEPAGAHQTRDGDTAGQPEHKAQWRSENNQYGQQGPKPAWRAFQKQMGIVAGAPELISQASGELFLLGFSSRGAQCLSGQPIRERVRTEMVSEAGRCRA